MSEITSENLIDFHFKGMHAEDAASAVTAARAIHWGVTLKEILQGKGRYLVICLSQRDQLKVSCFLQKV